MFAQLRNLFLLSLIVSSHEQHHHTAFERIGGVHEIKGFVHLRTILHLDELDELCQSLPKFGQNVLRHPHLKDKLLKLKVQDKINAMEEKCGYLLVNEPLPLASTPRVKRSFVLGVIGTVFGLFGLSHLLGLEETDSHLVEKVEAVEHEQELTRLRLEVIQQDLIGVLTALETLRQEVRVTNAVTVFINNARHLLGLLKTVEEAMPALHQHQLPPNVVPVHLLHKKWPQLQKMALQQKGQLAISHPLQTYQLPASAVIHERKLNILVHIPLVSQLVGWNLYAMQQKPILVNSTSGNTMVAWVRPEHDFIASRSLSDRNYVVLTTSEVDKCLKVGHDYFCTGLVVRRGKKDTCLGRLFQNDLQDLHRYCPVFIDPVDHAAFQGTSAWRVFQQKSGVVRMSCSNGTTLSWVKQGVFDLSFDPGCDYVTPHFHLHGDPTPLSDHLEAVINLTPAIGSINALGLDEDDLPPGWNTTEDRPKARIPLSDLLAAKTLRVHRQTQHRHSVVIWSVVASLTMILLIMGISCGYNYRQRPRGDSS